MGSQIMNIEMELSRILIQENSDQQFIFLKEKNGDRSFPIVIGTAEAFAIDRRLKNIKVPRPLTHDLIFNVITEMGGSLERIVINDLRNHTFFARLIIGMDGNLVEVDARPSDAIALGIVNQTPIFCAEHVLDEAS